MAPAWTRRTGFHLRSPVASAPFKQGERFKGFQPWQQRAQSTEAKDRPPANGSFGSHQVVLISAAGPRFCCGTVLLGTVLEAGACWGELLFCWR